ncbi:MAG: PAS domain S-box protein [Planctomycetia bacterium]|nr:PAS domain S-box protein [Planctomycetia bacterium]
MAPPSDADDRDIPSLDAPGACEPADREHRALADFFDNAPVALHWVGPDGTIQRVNQAELKLLGYRRDEYVGHHIAEFHADQEVIRTILDRLAQGQDVRDCQARLRAKDGSIKHVLINSSGLAEDGQFVHSRCVTLDITRQRLVEASLRESEQRFVRFMQHLPGLAWIKDARGRYVYANDAAEEAFQVPRARLYGRSDDEVFPPLTAAQFKENDQKAFASAAGVQMVETLRHGDGVLHYSIVSKFPIFGLDDRPGWVGGIAIDVTEHMRTERALRELGAIVESSEDAIIGQDLKGNITSWNAGARKLYGYTAEEVVGRRISLLDPPDYHDEGPQLLARLERGESVRSYETKRLTKDGRRIEVSLSFSPIKDEQGTMIGAAKIARDITERKRAEAALREVDQRKDRFLALLGHELRNPLAGILNGVQVLKLAGAPSPDAAEMHDVIERQATQMARLIDDLLDLSRISEGKISLRPQRVDLAEVARLAVEDHRPVFTAHAVALEVASPSEPLWIDGDSVRLSQVLGNLLHNAVKFSNPGGTVRVSMRRDAENVVLAVHDSGIGMTAETLARLFEPFTQADQAADRNRGGLGLGLALVKGLVELHRGTVEAESAGVGRGSIVTVRLPLLSRDQIREDEKRTPVASKPARVLVIDDSRDACLSLSRLLEIAGHNVVVAVDGPTGVERAREFLPDVILCDINLQSDMDGYAVARAVRGDRRLKSTFLVAITGYGQEDDRRRALEAGFDRHLTKPVGVDALQSLLAGVPSAASAPR